MGASIQQILNPIVLTKVISRQMSAERWVLPFFGFQPGGPNEEFFGHGRTGAYQVFNNTRQIARGRAPGTAAAIAKRQNIGQVPIVYPRMHEEIQMLAEELHNLAQIGDPRTRDVAGATMIRRQTSYLAQKTANWRVAQAFGMCRDSLYVKQDGDDWVFDFDGSGAQFRINFNMPATNQGQLADQMGTQTGGGNLIDASWNNPNTDIPGHLQKIDAAFQNLYGGHLRNIFVPGAIWQNVLNNDAVGAQAGIANTPFTIFERVVGTREDGSPLNVSVGQIAARPDVRWYIIDEGLDMGLVGQEVFRRFIPVDQIVCLPDVNMGIFSMQLGSEPIAEFDGGPETVRIGVSSWAKRSANPTVTEIFALDNALAINHIPVSIANPTVVF